VKIEAKADKIGKQGITTGFYQWQREFTDLVELFKVVKRDIKDFRAAWPTVDVTITINLKEP